MLQLHYSNRLENLIEPLAEQIAASQRIDPIARIPIIVPNRAVEQFVKYRIAERLGVAANLEFPFLRGYLAQIVSRADESIRVLDTAELQLALFECMRGAETSAAKDFAAIRNYVEDSAFPEGSARADAYREHRTFQIAQRVARLFREYSITRSEMTRGWRTKGRFDKPPFADSERWQRALWLRMLDEHGVLKREFINDPSERWMMLSDAFGAIDRTRLTGALPPALHVFALPTAGPAYIRIFANLAGITDLHIYAFNPCLEFWEDLQTVGAAARENWVRRNARGDGVLADDKDQFGLVANGDTLALKLWGRPGREYIRLLNELADCDFDARFARPANGAQATLLASIQDDILMRAAPRAQVPDDDRAYADDRSIRILACPGVRREVEAVAGAIWAMMRDSTISPPLRFHEIAVMAPESSCEDYFPHIETVFREQHEIPVEITSRGFVRQSRVAEAIDLLLKLPLGRLSREEMVRLLTHPAIVGTEGDYDVELWAARCRDAGVVFGADGQELGKTYIGPNLYHWDQALRRLALGVFASGELSGVTEPVETPDGSYLPVEVAQDAAEGVARMVRLAREIIAEALEIRDATLSLKQWSEMLSAIVVKYVHADGPADERVLGWCLRAIAAIAPDEVKTGPVHYETAHALAADAISDAEAAQTKLSGRGVAAGSMTLLRAIPFRAVFVLGLGETLFPERERRDPLDLTLAQRFAGDVSPTERDRYLFLETILAARERLSLSYVSRDSQTGEALEPSAAIRELEFILRGYVGGQTLKRMTIRHPVSRYDLKYFPDLPQKPGSDSIPELISFDPDARHGARMSALREDLSSATNGIPLPGRENPIVDRLPEPIAERIRSNLCLIDATTAEAANAREREEISISISALRRYLECPLQGAARYALGMREEEDGGDEDSADEPLEQSVPERVVMMRDAFWDGRGESAAMREAWERRFSRAQMKGSAPTGVFADAASKASLGQMQSWVDHAADAGIVDLTERDRWPEVRIGRADEFTDSDVVLEPVVLEVDVHDAGGGKRKQRVRLDGGLGRIHRASAKSPFDTALLAVAHQKVQSKDFLRLAIAACALAAAGARLGKEFAAVIVGASKSQPEKRKISFAAMDQKHARSYLSDVVSDLLSVGNDNFIPIEAVEMVHKEVAKGADDDALENAVDGLRDNDRTSSERGPVRDARARFEPPSGAQIRRILKRRYEPIRAIFGDSEETR